MSIPDAQIHPVATGVASETVAKHQAPQEITLWSGWFCPFVQRIWIALEEREIPYQYKEVNPYKKEKHFLAINPKDLVPAVEYKGKALYESLVLLEFLEEAYPTVKPSLFPEEPYDRAVARIWVDHITKNYVPAFHRLLQAQEPEKQEQARNDFFGEQFGVVDVAVAPWIVRDWVITENRGYSRSQAGEAWTKYAKAVTERPSLLKTESDKEHYGQIYGRYLRNEAQSEAAKAIRAGKQIP